MVRQNRWRIDNTLTTNIALLHIFITSFSFFVFSVTQVQAILHTANRHFTFFRIFQQICMIPTHSDMRFTPGKIDAISIFACRQAHIISLLISFKLRRTPKFSFIIIFSKLAFVTFMINYREGCKTIIIRAIHSTSPAVFRFKLSSCNFFAPHIRNHDRPFS